MAQEQFNGASMHWSRTLLIILVTIVVTIAGTYWVLKTYLFTTSFTPVALNAQEERVLESKLKTLGYVPDGAPANQTHADEIDEHGFLKPEAYSEKNASREVNFTERELNALLAKNTDLARKLAIDLSDGLVSAKLLIPLEEDFPVLGGKTLRLNAGVGMVYRNEKPVIVLQGISIMGVPVPNAWLGGLKNIDLVNEFGTDPGFWQSFADGVEHIEVIEGRIKIKFKE